MARGIIVGRLVKKATLSYATGRAMGMRKDGSVYVAKTGPWRVEMAWGTGGAVAALYHYGTRMLEWSYSGTDIKITGWWVGHGSVSDQQGVNAALHELGAPQRYYRDIRGGGPRVNPGYRLSASVSRAASSISSITPPEY